MFFFSKIHIFDTVSGLTAVKASRCLCVPARGHENTDLRNVNPRARQYAGCFDVYHSDDDVNYLLWKRTSTIQLNRILWNDDKAGWILTFILFYTFRCN